MPRTFKLIIPGKLPGLNEYSKAERSHPIKGNNMKAETQEYITYAIRKARLHKVHFDSPVYMVYLWVEKDRTRDKDNIAFAKKFIQDALVNAGTLKNDGWAQIEGFEDHFSVDKNHPRVEVEIREV